MQDFLLTDYSETQTCARLSSLAISISKLFSTARSQFKRVWMTPSMVRWMSARKPSNRSLYWRVFARRSLNSKLIKVGKSSRPSKLAASERTLLPKFWTWRDFHWISFAKSVDQICLTWLEVSWPSEWMLLRKRFHALSMLNGTVMQSDSRCPKLTRKMKKVVED